MFSRCDDRGVLRRIFSMSDNEYDPGTPYDPAPRRRRHDYRRESESEDAWAAADENDYYDDDVEIEDLAAGYLWEDHKQHSVERDANPTLVDAANQSPSRRRRTQRRRIPRDERLRHHRDRSQVYAGSSTYHRDQARRGEYGEYHERFQPKLSKLHDSHPKPRIPFWQILIVVILALFALLAVVLACVSVVLL